VILLPAEYKTGKIITRIRTRRRNSSCPRIGHDVATQMLALALDSMVVTS
jgi:hypothetical protein